jgi:hypothetical protein
LLFLQEIISGGALLRRRNPRLLVAQQAEKQRDIQLMVGGAASRLEKCKKSRVLSAYGGVKAKTHGSYVRVRHEKLALYMIICQRINEITASAMCQERIVSNPGVPRRPEFLMSGAGRPDDDAGQLALVETRAGIRRGARRQVGEAGAIEDLAAEGCGRLQRQRR